MNMVAKSKEEIFEIGEDSRSEYEQLNKELKDVQQKVIDVIERTERTELHSRFSRNRLAEVSRHFGSYTDDEVKEAYENAKDYQIQLAVLKQEEQQLRERRDRIERRLLKLSETIERADQLINQINAVIHYLSGDLQAMADFVHDAEEMQKFGVKIIQAQEEERKKLSREIHDGPAQSMANVMLRSELVEKVLEQESVAKAQEEIRDLRMMVQSTLSEVRRIIYDLRPMTLDDLGLAPTLAKYLRTVDEHHEAVTIRFKNVGDDRRLASHIEIAIFRFIQEAVQNALKHAEPRQIEVKLELKNDRVTALVRDDGKGFLIEEASESSFGLVGMRERVNMLDGELTIDSKPSKGALLMMNIPITAKTANEENTDN